MQMRRNIPRQPAEWSGSYRYGFDGDAPARQCRVLDISTAGAGLDLFDTTPEECMDQLVVVTVELRGDMRDAVSWPNGHTRVGIEFSDLTGEAAAYVRTLRGFGARTRW